jgi:hypothetical protein
MAYRYTFADLGEECTSLDRMEYVRYCLVQNPDLSHCRAPLKSSE